MFYGTFFCVFVLRGNHDYVDMIVEKQLKHSMSWKILLPKMLSLPLNLPQIRRAYFVSVWHSCFFWIPHKKSCFVTQANISHKYLSIGLSVRPFSNFTGWLDSLKGLYWQIKQTRCLSRISPYMLYAQNNAYVSIYNLKLPDSW